MPFDDTLAGRVRAQLKRRRNIIEKKMFGGVGFLLKGNMLVGVWKHWLIVRIGDDQAEAALRDPNVKVFDITGRAMKGWIMVEPAGCADDDALKAWIADAVKFVSKLPAK